MRQTQEIQQTLNAIAAMSEGPGAGVVVPAGDTEALSRALDYVLGRSEIDRRELGMAGRRRIVENFSLEATVNQYLEVYEGLMSGQRTCAE